MGLVERLAKRRFIHESMHGDHKPEDVDYEPTPNESRHARWWLNAIADELEETREVHAKHEAARWFRSQASTTERDDE